MVVPIVNDLSTFIGQAGNIDALRFEIDGAKVLGAPVRHMLLIGNAGLGKTTLARCIAGEMVVKIHERICTPNFKVHQLSQLVESMQAFEFLFLDEIHVADHPVQEAIQRVITEQVISGFKQDTTTGKWKQGEDLKVPPLTIIGATDRPGVLLKALLSRFGAPVAMRPYNLDELRDIVRAKACQLNLLLVDGAATKIAESCAGNPREATQRLDLIHKYAASAQITEITTGTVQICLNANGMSGSGLGYTEQEYLRQLKSAGVSGERLMTLQSLLSMDAAYIQKHIEPKLIYLGLIKIDQRRHLTLKGAQYISRNFQ